MNPYRLAATHRPSRKSTVRSHELTPIAAAMRLLPPLSSTGAPLQVELPPGDALRMRNLVHRGTQRPVFKVPSLRLDRPVQCESILEYEATVLLDVAPGVSSFAEQPARIHYVLDGERRTHVPDFAVLVGSRHAFLEIKFEKDVDEEVRERTTLLQHGLVRHGWEYHLLTEAVLRRGVHLANAQGILRRARHAASEVDTLRVLERLRRASRHVLGDFGWNMHGNVEALSVAQLITTGLAAIDWSRPLSETSSIWATNEANNEEAAPWLLAPSA